MSFTDNLALREIYSLVPSYNIPWSRREGNSISTLRIVCVDSAMTMAATLWSRKMEKLALRMEEAQFADRKHDAAQPLVI
jgi:hypothetical protein